MLAESTKSGSSAYEPLLRKKWEVTTTEGFVEWKLQVDAMINADTKAQPFRDVDAITPSIVAAAVPGFAALAAAKQAEYVEAYRTHAIRYT